MAKIEFNYQSLWTFLEEKTSKSWGKCMDLLLRSIIELCSLFCIQQTLACAVGTLFLAMCCHVTLSYIPHIWAIPQHSNLSFFLKLHQQLIIKYMLLKNILAVDEVYLIDFKAATINHHHEQLRWHLLINILGFI